MDIDLADLHARMLERAVAAVRTDGRFEALLGTGSRLAAFGGARERDQALGSMLRKQTCA